ncbi:MAG: hypothetical protein GX802_00680 [Clostridiales bacterium]|jgi:hypothetical protein|nr:hypothetical protein [Clostridiales bacterium]
MSKKDTKNKSHKAVKKSKLDPKTKIMLVVLSIALVGVIILAILGLKSSLLTPQRADGSRIDIDAMKAAPIVVRSNGDGNSSYDSIYFTPIGNMVYDQEKSNGQNAAYYSNEETGTTMNIYIKDEATAYKQIQEFSEFATEKGTISPIEIVRKAFAEDISKVSLTSSSFSDAKRAGTIKKICGLYVGSNEFSFSEINGDLYGAMTYSAPNVYGIDLVHNGKLYTINFRGTDLEPITLDLIVAFLQSIKFAG